MKYLLLDIDDTIALLKIVGPNMVTVDRRDVEISIPTHVAKWLKKRLKKFLRFFGIQIGHLLWGQLSRKQYVLKQKANYNFSIKKHIIGVKFIALLNFVMNMKII